LDCRISTKGLVQGTFQEVEKGVAIRISNNEAAPRNCSQTKGRKG
jgi:hypothetical protein